MNRILSIFLVMTSLTISMSHAFVPPSTPSSNLTFSNVSANQMRLQWTSGDGAMRIVVARKGSAVDVDPIDGIDYVNYQSLSSGQLVVYEGSGNSFDFKSDGNGPLDEGVEYYFEIFEYNGSGATTEYLTASSATGSQIAQVSTSEPSTGSSSIIFSSVTGSSANIQWTIGDGTNRIVLAKEGSAISANLNDGSPYSLYQSLADGSKVIYNGTGNSLTFNTLGNGPLTVSTTYYIALIEYNGSGITANYANGLSVTNNFITSSIASEPTVQVSNVSTSFETDDPFVRIDLDWTAGNGTNTMVIFREGTPIDPSALPVDGTDYPLWNEIASGHKVCYKGTATHLEFKSNGLGDLSPNTTYYFAFFTFNGSDVTTNYLTTSPASHNETTVSSTVSTPASNISFDLVDGNSMRVNWTSGSGDGRIVIAKQGSAVNYLNYDLPKDGTTYTVNQNLGSGNYVVYNGTGSNFIFDDIGGPTLTQNTAYHFAIIEYSGSGSSINYLNESPSHVLIGNQATLDFASEPTVASSNLVFSNVSNNSMTLTWTAGNGASRIVVARESATVTGVPSDGTEYTQYQSISSGNIVVYIGTGNSIVFTNDGGGPLTPGATYYFEIFEYNGSEATSNYLTSTSLTGSQEATSGSAEPTTPASNLVFSNVQQTQMTLTWTNGNGAQRIVISREGSAVDVTPVDGVDYSLYQSLSAGQKVVYEGSSNTFNFRTNGNGPLTPNTTYHFAIFEFNETGSLTNYLTSSFLTGSQATLPLFTEPTIPSSNLTFTNILDTEMTLNWTSGDGSGRIIVAREGSAVSVVPSDGTDYSLYQSLSLGQKIVYEGTGNSFRFYTNGNGPLKSGTTYHFAIFEFNGSGSDINYLTISYLIGSQTTTGVPTIAPPQPGDLLVEGEAIDSPTDPSTTISSSQVKKVSEINSDPNQPDLQASDVMLYPNPTSSVLNVSLISRLQGVELDKIVLYNTQGEILSNFEIGASQFQIDVTNLSQGMYFIKIQYNNGYTVKRFLVN